MAYSRQEHLSIDSPRLDPRPDSRPGATGQENEWSDPDAGVREAFSGPRERWGNRACLPAAPPLSCVMPDTPKRLFLLDGMALVYRAHFALIRSPIYTSNRVNTSALFGFTNTLLELIENRRPTHLAVAFDTEDPTPRHKIYPEYKANRDEMPEDLALQIPHVKRMIEAFRIPVIECPGYEADDIIGTLARRAEEEGDYEIFMVTPDKDFSQLVTDRACVYKPGRQGSEVEILDRATICDQWQVEDPKQVIDVLGLWGDSSDNIPGVPGIGEKTAKKLIARFGSVESLLEQSGELKGKQKENVENHREQALLSKELATILTDVPVDVDFATLEIEERDDDSLRSLLVEFEFNAIGKRLFGEDFKAGRGHSVATSAEGGEKTAELKTIDDVETDYRFIRADEDETRAALLAELGERESFCFDLETDRLDEKTARIIGIAFSWEKGRATYVEVPEGEEGRAILGEFVPVWACPDTEKVGHNLKFDIGVLRWQGWEVKGRIFDTMLAHTLVEPDQRHKMDYLAESLLGYTPISYASVFGTEEAGSGQLQLFSTSEVSDSGPAFEDIARYACEDADVTWQLAAILREKLDDYGQGRVFHGIECPLVPVIVGMEREGIRLDPDALAETGQELDRKMAELRERVFEAAGREFNINSPKQVGEVFFDTLKLVEKPKKTKTGQYKTDEQTLTSLAAEHPVVRDLLDHREAAKLKSTYVDALPETIFAGTGRIHTTFHQLLTATGRFASQNPNLQNIPVRSELGREIRKAFVPRDEDFLLLSADYSQIELRVLASMCGDPAMIEAFRNDEDIHTSTAARVFGVAPGDVISEMRRTAKMVNFGIIYGISAFGLSQRLGGEVSRSEASDIIAEYFRQYPKVKEFQETTIATAEEKGYVETITGRRRHLRDIGSRNATIRSAAERTAINTPIQGTAADMIKIAMIRVADLLDRGNYRTRMLLQVHDELVFDLARDEADELIPQIEAAMRDALPLEVPVVVESGTGENWLAAH